MKQIGHAETLIKLLSQANEENDDEQQQQSLENLLTAQLSHSDGIRGFFVNYLTAAATTSDDEEKEDGSTVSSSPADYPIVPKVLQKAMSKVDPNELVPLACKLPTHTHTYFVVFLALHTSLTCTFVLILCFFL